MKKLVWALLFLPLFSYAATVCPSWTDEQKGILRAAKAYGEPYDLSLTLAAIVIQEAFVGPYVVRHNVEDSGGGSFGVTHIQLRTAMYFLDIKNVWEARAVIPKQLLTDDDFSFMLSVMKLQQSRHLPWRQMVARYNGRGPKAQRYAERVASHVEVLKVCFVEEE